MSFPKINELKDLELNEIKNEILALKKELFELRLKKAARQSFKPHSFKHIKHRLRLLINLEYEKLNAN